MAGSTYVVVSTSRRGCAAAATAGPVRAGPPARASPPARAAMNAKINKRRMVR
jgi:hypothetical protein